jgi:hypothetical protein
MKKVILSFTALLVCASANAAPAADISAIRAYAKRALPKCPDAIMTVEPFTQSGPLPMNFILYDVTVQSTDEGCSTRKYLLYSPITQQVLIGTVIALPADGRPAKARIEDQASNMLKEHIIVDVGAFPLPDGLKSVTMTKSTAYGPFAYHAFLDASERFLIVASRGNLRTDPGTTLREGLGVENAVRRGNKASKVEIIELSDFECPTCGREHKLIEPILEKNLSKVDYKRLDLPLYEHHEWAMFAALGAHAIQKVAPAKYWDYANFVFANQETIGKQSFDKTLKNFCEDHDIPWAKVDALYRSNSQRQALLDQVSRAFDNGISSTPTFILNGQILGFGKEGTFMIGEIKKALGVK